ncbi:MAG: hypothetical protein ACKOBW_12585 [Planctomycetota bacterium]
MNASLAGFHPLVTEYHTLSQQKNSTPGQASAAADSAADHVALEQDSSDHAAQDSTAATRGTSAGRGESRRHVTDESMAAK